jgi:hypothetical protein
LVRALGEARPRVARKTLEPYEETLKGKSATSKRTWAASVLRQVDAIGFDLADMVFEIHAGAEYRNFGLVDGLRSRGAGVEIPAEHLSQGEQLAFYGGMAKRPVTPAAGKRSATIKSAPGRSSYLPLAAHLSEVDAPLVQLSFTQIERILGRPLPASARRYRSWWSNESSGTHTQTAAWMGSGWLVDRVDFNAGLVHFSRGRR